MVKISVLYKNAENAKFDIDYFLNLHIPLLKSVIGDKAANMAVDQGLAGGTPPPFIAMAHLYFNTMEDFQAAMSSGAETIMNDIPNYTNCEPVIQISEVKI